MILSILLIVTFGMVAGRLFSKLNLPGLLGMIIVGVALGPHGLGLLDPTILENSRDIRMIALLVILLRAGLGLEKDLLKSVGAIAAKMSAIPCLLEGFTITGVAHLLLKLPLVEAGMLGFIVAAVSPAVIVPAMLQLKERRLGMKSGVPVIVLAGASIDDVFAITLFSVFLGLGTQSGDAPLWQIARIPVQIIGGVVLGALAGWGLDQLFRRCRGQPGCGLAGRTVGSRHHRGGLDGSHPRRDDRPAWIASQRQGEAVHDHCLPSQSHRPSSDWGDSAGDGHRLRRDHPGDRRAGRRHHRISGSRRDQGDGPAPAAIRGGAPAPIVGSRPWAGTRA